MNAAAGPKYDAGKTRMDLLPWRALRDVAEVMTFGAKKYYPNSWRVVPHARSRYFAAFMRHAEARIGGEFADDETGLPHAAHMACNALFICALDSVGDFFESEEGPTL